MRLQQLKYQTGKRYTETRCMDEITRMGGEARRNQNRLYLGNTTNRWRSRTTEAVAPPVQQNRKAEKRIYPVMLAGARTHSIGK